jgi:hypothetical protein
MRKSQDGSKPKKKLKMPEHVAWINERLYDASELVTRLKRRKHRIPQEPIEAALRLKGLLEEMLIREIFGCQVQQGNPEYSGKKAD